MQAASYSFVACMDESSEHIVCGKPYNNIQFFLLLLISNLFSKLNQWLRFHFSITTISRVFVTFFVP